MNKKQIIDEISNNKLVERLIKKVCKTDDDDLEDLTQDIYLSLLEKSEDLISYLYSEDELEFFIIKMIKNNYFSKNSPFYKNYKKYQNLKEPLEYEETGEEIYGEEPNYF